MAHSRGSKAGFQVSFKILQQGIPRGQKVQHTNTPLHFLNKEALDGGWQ